MWWTRRPPLPSGAGGKWLKPLRRGDASFAKWPRMVRFLALHCLMGTTLGAAFAGLLMLTNVGGLMDLIATSDQPALPIAMLVVGCALTFGSAAMAAAVMSLNPDD